MSTFILDNNLLFGLSLLQKKSLQDIAKFLKDAAENGATAFPHIPYYMFIGYDNFEAEDLRNSLRWSWENQTKDTPVPAYFLNQGFVDGGFKAMDFLSKSIRTVLDLSGGIRPMFYNNEQGLWFDPSDFERYMASKGPELAINGGFDTDLAGWSNIGTGGTRSAVSGEARITGGTSPGLRLLGVLVPGRWYEVFVRSRRLSGTAGAFIGLGGTSLTPVSTTNERVRFTGQAGSNSNFDIGISGDASTTEWAFDDISVRELTAIDTATMFQDAAGTTPITALEQPVGLILDRSKGLVLGPNIVTNGTFDSGITGWLDASTSPATFTWDASGKASLTRTDTNNARMDQQLTTVAGTWYEVLCTVGSVSVNVQAGATQGSSGYLPATTLNTGARSIKFLAGSSTTWLRFFTTTTGTTTVDDVSIRELPGNHASQSTAASRPVLSARKNILFYTSDPMNSNWTLTSVTRSSYGNVVADGNNFNAAIVAGQGAGWNRAQPPSFTWANGVAHAFTVYTIPGTSGKVRFTFRDNTALTESHVECVYGNAPVVTSTLAGSITISSHDLLAGGVYRTRGVFTPNATTASGQAGLGVGPASTVSGDTVVVVGVQIELGSTPTKYQRVGASSTDYDSVGFPHYLAFDGVDDWLQTGNIDFTGTDKMTVVAGVYKASDAAVGALIELSADRSANSGAFDIRAPDNSPTLLSTFAKGVATTASNQQATTTASQYAAPLTAVVTAAHDIAGDRSELRISGVLAGTATGDKGTGSFGNYPLYIGRRGGSTLPFNGRIHQLIVRGAKTEEDKVKVLEKTVANKTGVTLNG